jgi:class 3 adenylate cyclase
MPQTKRRLRESVLASYDARRSQFAQTRALAKSAATGHPAFEDLRVGEKRPAHLASVFLDLRQFTSRSFWDDDLQVADLANSVLSGLADVVADFRGHVIGLRGDGLLATFGDDTWRRDLAVWAAAAASATAIDQVEKDLNPALKARGIEPVQLRAGADYGRVVFVRSGTDVASEVNITGFSTNFAAKAEKKALSWEMVVGEGFASDLPSALLRAGEGSPKVYTRGDRRRTYSFYNYDWRALNRELDDAAIEDFQRLYPELVA